MTRPLPQAPTGRADLVRLAVARGDRGLRAAAKLLGYVEVEENRAPPKLNEPAKAAPVANQGTPPKETTPTEIEYDDIPYWHAVAVERGEDHEPGDEPWDLLTPEMLRRALELEPPERPLLVSRPVLRRVLDEHLRLPRESHRIDVDRLTALWCRGRVPRHLPRESRRHLGRVSLIVDRDRRLAPFWDDQADVVRELAAAIPANDLRLLPSPPEGAISSSALDENDVVLVLGDLGFYGDTPDRWRRLARRFQPTGARLRALVPCPPRLWHRATARAWSATDWEQPHRLPRAGSGTDPRAAIEPMLRLLSMAVRIEPGLVRELRRFVPSADCGTEVELQQHPDLATRSLAAWQFTETAIQKWRSQLAGLSRELRQAVARAVVRWHRHLSIEVRAELSEILRSVEVFLDDELGVTEEEVFRIFQGVAAVLEQERPTDPRMTSALSTWLPRVAAQLPKSTWRSRLSKALVRAYSAYREKHPEADLPPGVTSEMLAGKGTDRPVERWDVRQVGDRLRIEPANTWGEGSFVASISAREPKLWLASQEREPVELDFEDGVQLPSSADDRLRLVSDVEEVVLESTLGPSWATRTGRDGYGFWAVLEIGAIEQRMRWIPPGRFRMGSPEDEVGRTTSEGPRHQVTLSEGFWIAETPCTQAFWEAVTGESPSHFEGAERPVERVSWQDVQVFLDRLSFRARGLDARLPTEAEWEYACRAGAETPTWLGENNREVLDQIAIYNQNSRRKTHEVGGRAGNPWGLSDILGNVYEWCWDWEGSYGRSAVLDPEGPNSGSLRVLRGGSWASLARDVRAAYRLWYHPGLRFWYYGFRLSSGPGGRGAQGRERADAAPEAAARGTSRRARSRRSLAWVDRIEWAVDGGTDAFGRWAAFEVEGVRHHLRWIYPGRFRMGSPEPEAGRLGTEGPAHTVELSEGFWLGEGPCTQDLYEAVMGENPSRFRSARRPVEQVSWDDCQRFFEQLRAKVPNLDGRLPTEAEWEYACRAGTEAATWLGDLEILGANNAPLLDEIAWYGGNSGVDFDLSEGSDSSGWPEKQYPHELAGTREEGLKRPNPWGLHDMLGNVWEWCQDAWDGSSGYPGGDRIDPVGSGGSYRVLRGGSWLSGARRVRAAYRYWYHPGDRFWHYGFRLSSGPGWRTPR